VSPSRVFAIFGPVHLVDAFAKMWSSLTGSPVHHRPFYDAFYTSCTRGTFNSNNDELPQGHRIQTVQTEDVGQASILCMGFARTTIYYTLTLSQSNAEASRLIQSGELWGYLANDELVAIVALTRPTPSVMAITKVFTAEEQRRKGYASALVRHVCDFALNVLGKNRIVLYVAGENVSAMKLYGTVGFRGVGHRARIPGESVRLEHWREVGFENTTRGYW